MGYDEELANRIREVTDGAADITERKMFGGLAFLAAGNMAVAASGEGRLMVRVDPDEVDALLAKPGAHPMEMRGRPMRGWLRVAPEDLDAESAFTTWVETGLAYARSLPAK